jgi:hypothetical protein
MPDRSQPALDDAKLVRPKVVKRPEPKQMSLWDSFMLILRPERKP